MPGAHLRRACERLPPLPKPLATPERLPVADAPPVIDGEPALALADLRMVELPVRRDGTVVDWAAPILAAWDISEGAALAIMEQFLAEGAWQGPKQDCLFCCLYLRPPPPHRLPCEVLPYLSDWTGLSPNSQPWSC